MKKHRINNIMKLLHKNLSYATREANLTLRAFCVCSACVVQSVTHHVWVLSVAGIVIGHLEMYRTKVLLYRTMVLMACLTKVRR